MCAETVILSRQGAVATIRLNRPGKRNALTLGMWRLLASRVAEAEADPAVKVLVVTGAGDAFAAGADIAEFGRVFQEAAAAAEIAEVTYAAQKRLADCAKPTIARIAGPCVGGGCGIALCCDLRFADDTARFAVTPAKLGLVYSVADTRRLVDAVGPAKAKDILFTGRTLDAGEALRIGLIDRLLPPGELDSAVDACAAEICAVSQATVRAAKRIVGMILNGAADDTPETRRMFVDAFSGPDFREGHGAFAEKRKPRFSQE